MKANELVQWLTTHGVSDMEVLVTDSDVGEVGAEVDRVGIRRIFDNDAPEGERRVVVLHMKHYGEDVHEFIDARHHGD